MKQLLQQYAAYNLWANKRITETAQQLPDELINKEIVSSFPSVYKTLLHLMEVENIWWERLKLNAHADIPDEIFTGNFSDVTDKLLQLSLQWSDWVQQANDNDIATVFAYRNSMKQDFDQPVFEMLVHLFNHQTFHRGQLMTMFRQLGVQKILPTDFIVFSRGK
jgi:uncharacterized damage-inducible protein DinB